MPVEIEKKVVLRDESGKISLRVHRTQVFSKEEDDMQIELTEDGSGYGEFEKPSRLIWFRVTRADLMGFVAEVKELVEGLPPVRVDLDD